MHCEFVAAVHVSSDVQWVIGVQETHTSATPLTRYDVDVHCVHCESEALVQVSGDVQPLTAVHCVQIEPPFATG